ncbi:uncharacterized protein LOC134267343, partial [Saccostrea cucullata]|uniref:uncharacterized protein LOC134267343 n=1 Tax=Saccostrea cuccullata TaxID=36930 RepID=UPI002ED3417E
SMHNVLAQNEQNTCEMLTSGIQRCYAIIGIKLPAENIKSIMSVPLDYLDTCEMNLEQFFVCYESIILMCPNYLDANPLMMSKRSLQSVMFGLCENKEIYLQGLECAEKKSNKFHLYMQNCFGLRHFGNAVDARAARNWTGFCGSIATEFSCAETILKAFECGEDFLRVSMQFLHAIQPTVCMDNSIYWDWVRRFGGNGVSTLYSSSLLLVLILFPLLFLIR